MSNGKTILVVDDNEDNVEILRAHLSSRGYIVSIARDGRTAIDSIYASHPNLVLLDVMMPVMTGIEVVEQIKTDSSLPFIPIILQTALDTTDNIVDGLNAGADDYISKPINLRELDARVRSLLRIKTLQDSLAERERELSALNEKLLITSQVDGLTNIANRRHIDERLVELWEHSLRYNEDISIVMCDIDHFKNVNDTHGHIAGDEVLKKFAHLLKATARGIDKIGRYGGEEFLIVLPGTGLEAALTFAERVRKAIESHTFSYDGGTLNCTASIGVSSWPHQPLHGQDALVNAADKALYAAKKLGRNRVISYASREFNESSSTKQSQQNA